MLFNGVESGAVPKSKILERTDSNPHPKAIGFLSRKYRRGIKSEKNGK